MEKPNILIIHADQHRHDCLGCAGNPDIKTPHLDALAKDGIRYTHTFAPFPLCTPSRYSFLTGLYARQHLGTSNQASIPEGLATFPKLLQTFGYRTICIGKMHYSPTYSDVGFQEMLLAEQDGPGRFEDDYHRELLQKGCIDFVDARDQVFEFRGKAPAEYHQNFGSDKSNLSEAEYSTTWIGEKALETLSQWNENGQMLMVGFIKPHHPFDVPSPWSDMYDPSKLTLLPGWTDTLPKVDEAYRKGFFDNKKLEPKILRKIMAQYYGAISQIDAYIGKIVKFLKDRGLYEKTMIIYTSDHGEYMGYHHMILKGNYMYDPLIRVPLIVKMPQDSPQPQNLSVQSKLVSIMDITATILDVSGCQIPKYLWEQIQPLADVDRDAVFAETGEGHLMIRTTTHKLLYCKEAKSQFFDLVKDPQELKNVIDDPAYENDIKTLQTRLLEWCAFEVKPFPYLDAFRKVIGPSQRLNIKTEYRNQMLALLKNHQKEKGKP